MCDLRLKVHTTWVNCNAQKAQNSVLTAQQRGVDTNTQSKQKGQSQTQRVTDYCNLSLS